LTDIPATDAPTYDAGAILALGLDPDENDAGAATVRDYLVTLLATVWECGEGFSGKRPFGNSGWSLELCKPLVAAGIIPGSLNAEGFLVEFDRGAAHEALAAAIEGLRVAATDA
jgi:hypothetical protein